MFTEQEDSEVSEAIDASIDEAQTVLFLGFGFEEQNMRFFSRGGDSKKVFATLYGQKPQNRDFLIDDLGIRFSKIDKSVFHVDGKASDLFSDCYHPLTRAVGSI